MELIKELDKIISEFTLEDVLKFEEECDEQYHAIRFLAGKHTNLPNNVNAIVLINALVSYQLNCRGETYWWEFARKISNVDISNPVLAMLRFLRASRCNKRLLNAKLKKVEKCKGFISRILERDRFYATNLVALWTLLQRELSMKKDAKTLVFAVKMFNYATRITHSKKYIIPFEIPIPMDSRIIKITRALGVTSNAISFWRNFAESHGIPPLHLDSLLWVTLGMSKSGNDSCLSDSRIDRLKSFLAKIMKE